MKPFLAITMGDPSGIGPEISVKALKNDEVYAKCVPIIIGDYEALKIANEITKTNYKLHEIKNPSEALGKKGTIDFINLSFLSPGNWEMKKVNKVSGDAAFNYVVTGIKLAMENKVQGVITGPINKEAIHLAGHNYSGHTEIFADYTNTKDYGMVLMNDKIKVIHATTHVSMRKACDLITKERIYKIIHLAYDSLKVMGIENPKIGVAGLNAHASENGLFGEEEAKAIIPAISKAQEEGISVEGPIPPDTVFVKAVAGKYDIVVAMYHDQGHIPLKLLSFSFDSNNTSVKGINYTAGLPIIRVSVDHGTAFDIAGENVASEQSLIDSIILGAKIAEQKIKDQNY